MRPSAYLMVLWCVAALAQIEPRQAAKDYPAQAVLSSASFGVEYLVRSVSAQNRTFFLNEYLVVELGVFPARGVKVPLALSQFRLRVTQKKKQETLPAIGPEFVAASLHYPDWNYRRGAEAAVGAGDGAVILGRPRTVERFPGDPSGRSRPPNPPRAPDTDHGVEQPEPVRAEDVVNATALREGEADHAVAGFLYFPWKGKTRDLRSVELVYEGPAGSAVVRLR